MTYRYTKPALSFSFQLFAGFCYYFSTLSLSLGLHNVSLSLVASNTCCQCVPCVQLTPSLILLYV